MSKSDSNLIDVKNLLCDRSGDLKYVREESIIRKVLPRSCSEHSVPRGGLTSEGQGFLFSFDELCWCESYLNVSECVKSIYFEGWPLDVPHL